MLEYAAECDTLQLFDFIYNSREHNLENTAGALYNAVACGRIENVKYLIDKKININSYFKDGHTALIYLANWGSTENHYEVVKLLLSNGADINIKNNGVSALELAKKYNRHKMYN